MNHRPAMRVVAPLLTIAASLLLTNCSGNRKLIEQAQGGEAAAQFEYGRRLLTGQHLPNSDAGQAAQWFRLAAQQGYAPAQAALGACYEAGLGLSANADEARYWYNLAAEQGSPLAAMHLAMAEYRQEKNPARALILLEKAADAGNVHARLHLARLLLLGEQGVSKDTRRATDHLRIAAMDGSAEAAYLMGLIYASGEGVPQHSGIALGWFENAAETGYAPARVLLEDLNAAN